jgi:hypothetical protein
MKTIPHCLVCGQPIAWGVHLFSHRIYGHSLCIRDQYILGESGATAEVVDLYLALRSRHFPVILEYFDDHKMVDIALPEKLYIEVNGPHHHEPDKNIPTIVISNAMLENPASFNHAVNEVSKVCRLMMKKPIITGMKVFFSPVQWQ